LTVRNVIDLSTKKIVVTGGAGFLGSYVVEQLRERGVKKDNLLVVRSKDFDLTREGNVEMLYRTLSPEIVIHLAAVVGGIGINRLHPGSFFYKNLIMGALLIEYARLFNVEKFVSIGTICAYPKFTPAPFKEEDIWNGYPEETNAPYGLAKKMMLVQSQAYRTEYDFNTIYLLPTNLYGPGDNFNPDSSHVIPALIKKCFDAIERGERQITVWGTGSASREFLYVDDAAEGIVLATEDYDGIQPVNLGSGSEISIRDLTDLIVRLTGFDGEVFWDASKPDGQPRRKLDVSRAANYFGFTARTGIEEGLKATIEWYRQHVLRHYDKNPE
jgi:GDP-L-fucose synthase